MARPKKENGEPSAYERLTRAYWSQLSRMPFADITARGVAREAGVNHNTFYRYFDSVEDMAAKLFEDIVPHAAPAQMVALAAAGDANGERAASILSELGLSAEAMQMAWLYAKSGSSLLTGLLRHRLERLWIEAMSIDEDALDRMQRAEFTIIFGGLVAAMGNDTLTPDPASVAATLKRPLGQAMADTLARMPKTARCG